VCSSCPSPEGMYVCHRCVLLQEKHVWTGAWTTSGMQQPYMTAAGRKYGTYAASVQLCSVQPSFPPSPSTPTAMWLCSSIEITITRCLWCYVLVVTAHKGTTSCCALCCALRAVWCAVWWWWCAVWCWCWWCAGGVLCVSWVLHCVLGVTAPGYRHAPRTAAGAAQAAKQDCALTHCSTVLDHPGL
jgi:hypothetical protein